MRTSLSRTLPTSRTLTTSDPLVRLVESVLGRDPFTSEELSDRWAPPVDIRETDDAFLVEAELPGLKKEDVDITIESNMLRLRGERRFEREKEEENFHRMERAYGSFTRTFSLPSRVDSEGVEASFRDGILTVKVPKTAESRPRKIEIH